ncbi:lysozyme [Lysinibacillus sp. NPDC092081]|uniref:lysozyme n=1 Tax=Lysinibacillus sp. NPDC092081 TaxID=3364131 RepID=UPI00382F3A29
MKISNTAINLISKWEGFYDKAYRDPVNIWTIGYGTTKWPNGQAVKQGETIRKVDALELLRKQTQEHADTIEQYVKVSLNQNQYDALASFQYNLGRNILRNSALLNYLNARQWDKACAEMLLYCNAGGKPLQGLVNRRKDEVALFKKPTVDVSVDVSKKIEYLEIDKEPKKFRILSGNYGNREAMIAAMNVAVQQGYLTYAESAQGNSIENGWRFISGWSNTLSEAKRIAERAILANKLSYATIRGTSK